MKKWAVILFIGLVGCNKAQRQLEKTQEYLFKHPEFTADVCAEQFPDKPDSVIIREVSTDTVTQVEQLTDTLRYNDTIRITEYKIKTVKVTVRKDSIIYRENRAEQERLQLGLLACQTNNGITLAKNTKLEQDLADWKKKAKTRWLWLALLIGGAAAFTVFKVYKGIKPKLPV